MTRTYTFIEDGSKCTVPLTVEGGVIHQTGPIECVKHERMVPFEKPDEDCPGCSGALATLEYIGRGALKLAWSKLTKKVRPIEERERIWEICTECERFHVGWCAKDRGGCGCILPAKIILRKETCPDSKW